MSIIYQGTTSYLACEVWGADLTGVRSCVVTVDCGQLYNFDLSRLTIAYDPDALDYEASGVSAVMIHLTQAETLALRNAVGKVQVRWLDASGESGITDVRTLDIGKSLYKGVLV